MGWEASKLCHLTSLGDISMPRITLTISGQPNDELTHRVASELTQLTASLLNKPLDATMLTVDYFPKESWFIAGRS